MSTIGESNEGYVYEKDVSAIDGFSFIDGQAAEGGTNEFFGASYVNGDTIVIAYRGTDEGLPELVGDLLDVATGIPNAQVYDALKYYDEVAAQNPGKTIYVTGHSLGGALAGIVAALRGIPAYGNMQGTSVAAGYAFDPCSMSEELSTFQLGGAWYGVTQPDGTSKPIFFVDDDPMHHPPDGAQELLRINPFSGDAVEPIANLSSYTTEGEVLGNLGFSGAADAKTDVTVLLPSSFPLGSVDRHSIALLGILNWSASGNGGAEDWKTKNYTAAISELFDNDVAIAAVFRIKGSGGQADPNYKLLTSISLTGSGALGGTALQGYFDDVNAIARLQADSANDDWLHNSNVLKALAQISVQYAGQVARAGKMDDADGVFDYDANSSNSYLYADFSRSAWIKLDNTPGQILGIKTLVDAVSAFNGQSHSSIEGAVNKVWGGSTDQIVKLVAATADSDVQLSASSDAGVDPDPQGENPTDGAMLVGGGGNDSLTGAGGNDLLVGGDGIDTFDGKGGDDLLFGGGGNDTFNLGNENTAWVDGGADNDTVNYSADSGAHLVSLDDAIGMAPNGDHLISVIRESNGALDYIVSVESINLVGNNNKVTVKKIDAGSAPTTVTIDLGATGVDSNETLDFSGDAESVYLQPADDGSLEEIRRVGPKVGLHFKDFNTLILSANDDAVFLRNSENRYLTQLTTGGGNDAVWSDVINLKINTAADLDDGVRIAHAGKGSVINIGEGHAEITVSDDILVVGAKSTDVITSVGGTVLHGGVGHLGSESAWVTGNDGTRYGLNADGQLAIKDKSGAILYVADYAGGPNLPPTLQAAGILVGLVASYASRLLDLNRPFNDSIGETFKAGNAIYFTKTGKTIFKADPLVLDLNGDGIHLIPQSVGSPLYDVHNTGFGVHTGWVQHDDGLLVYDKNGNGQIDSGREMFGGPDAFGFDSLATYDLNADGVIDASDAIYGQLQVWQDINGDAAVDAGELRSLADLGIASISLTTADPTEPTIAGNTINAVASFTRADGTTGTIAGVTFTDDPFHSVYLGDTTVSADAAARPNLKGFGTLTDLQVAMTLDPTLIDVVDATLPDLTSLDLATLRAEALPIFQAWAQAVPLLDADGNPVTVQPNSHHDIAVLVRDGSGSAPVIDDYAYLYDDGNGNTYWKLASGTDVLDAQGAVIDQPTFADVLAQTATDGQWQDFSGSEIAFVERYFGQPLPLDQVPEDPSALLAAMSSFIGAAWTAMNLEAVRLAMQGPLASFFQGIEYDASDNKFRATTDQQLTPMYQVIFSEAPADAAGAASWLAEWKPIVDVVLGDLSRDGGVDVSYAYTFASMVRAYESVPLPVSIDAAAQAFGVPAGLIIEGGATLTGTDSADIFYLHGGDQTARGGAGLDNYVIGGTFGHITIDDLEGAASTQDPDILRFTNVRSTDITATRDGIDLILTVNGTGEQVTVLGEFTGFGPSFNGVNFNDDRGVAQIAFSDGVVWDTPDISWAVARPQPELSTITGTGAMDVLDGGAGGDTFLTGGNDGDIYLFGRGYGRDTIDDDQTNPFNESADYVEFNADVAYSDVTFLRDGGSSDLEIAINGTTDLLTITGQFSASYNIFGQMWFNRVEALIFSDGSAYGWEQIIQNMDANAGTAGNDTIYGFAYEDTLDGGAGDDSLSGGNEDDTYIFGVGYGHDTILEGADNVLGGMTDTLEFKADVLPEDVTFTRDGSTDDLLITLTSGDTVRAEGQFATGAEIHVWFNRIENFQFDSTGEVLTYEDVMQRILTEAKTPGNDFIYGFSREDTLDGGAGDDYLAGGNEGDTYIFGHGYDHDTISDLGDGVPEGDNVDKIEFLSDVGPADVQLSHPLDTDDLVLTIADTGDSLTVQNQFAEGTIGGTLYQIEEFHFADGTIWTANDIRTMLLTQAKTDGNDTIQGFSTSDVLDGGAGDDILEGEGGGDTYVFGRGYGHDVVNAYIGFVTRDQPDTLQFNSDVAPGDVLLTRLDDDLAISISGTDDQITIQNQFSAYWQIENFSLSDGTVWTWEDVNRSLIAASETSGDDIVTGFRTDDTLDGGLGNDSLSGASGDDTYIYDRGDGNDTITEGFDSSGTDQDQLIVHGVDLNAVTLVRDGNDLTLVFAESASGAGDGGSVLLKNEINDFYQQGVETIVFDGGTVWTQGDLRTMLVSAGGTPGNDDITGTGSADIIQGGLGDDTLTGRAGDDTYIYRRGDGNDTITESADSGGNDQDQLILQGVDPGALTLAYNGIDLTLMIAESASGAGDGGSILLKKELDSFHQQGVETIAFDDGTVWTQDDLRTMALAEASTSIDDTIIGFNTDDTITGGLGNDTLTGSSGNDTYVYNRGDGNDTITEGSDSGGDDQDQVILHGVAPSAVTLVRSGIDLTLMIAESAPGAGDGGSILLKKELDSFHQQGVETVAFDDGTVWTQNDLRTMVLAQASTSGDDTITGFNTDDTITGGLGNDTLAGSSGDDTYVYNRGDGNDTITEGFDSGGDDQDQLILHGLSTSAVTLARSGIDLTLVIAESAPGAGDGGSILLKKELDSFFQQGVETVAFDDGTVWTQDDLRTMVLTQASTPGDDTITGFNTADTITGGLGNDTLAGLGGNDTYIYNRGGGNDSISEVNGSGVDQLSLQGVNLQEVTLVRDGNDLALVVAESAPGAGDGGSILLKNELGTSSGQWVEQIVFADGTTWTQSSLSGMPMVFGDGNNDGIVLGTSANDLMDVQAGGVTLEGGAGSDTYVYGVGYGNDAILENSGSSDTDIVQLNDLNASDVTLLRTGNDLHIEIDATGETLIVLSHFQSSAYGVEQIQFADGSTYDRSAIATNAPILVLGTDGDDTLIGTSLDETLDGGAGNDVINGGAGNDIQYGGAGDDLVIANTGADLFDGGDGTDTIDFTYTSNDVGLDLAAGTATFENNDVEVMTNFENAIAGSGDNLIYGTSGANNLYGGDGNDTIYGGDGDDIIDGGAGNDAHYGGGGNDLIIANVGDDLFDGGDGVDSIDFTYTSNDVVLDLAAGTATFENNDVEVMTNFENVIAGSGDNEIYGAATANILDGGVGNDTIDGRAGNDTYVYALGDGSDLIQESGSSADLDTLKFTDLTVADLAFTRSPADANDLVITVNGTGEQITIDNQFTGAASAVETIQFANGTNWDSSHLLIGTSATETINGTTGNDTIIGNGGNDTLNGGGGYDTCRLGANMGQIVVNNLASDGVSDPSGELDFGDGITSQQLWFEQSGIDLKIDLLGTTSNLTVAGWYGGAARAQVQSVNLADGLKLDSQIAQLVSAMATYATANPGFDPAATAQVPDDASLQSAIAAAWHH